VLRIVALTTLALVAFAANSLLCRMALGARLIDAGAFTGIRVLSGALTLVPLALWRSSRVDVVRSGSWLSSLALFAYAIAFSFAYLSLSTATGALILFGAVQLTMIAAGVRAGERPRAIEWLGMALAGGGLGYLLLPGATAPSAGSAALMTLAGVAWGIYSLRGRGAERPLATTASNFVRAALPGVLLALALRPSAPSARGVILAVISGAITSGVGYAIWYAALRGHSATSAAVVQLAVPMIAAAGGIALLDERATLRLAVATALTLGGIALAVLAKQRRVTR
jgi:drug/metabolite transporter (DMT)-like permease